MKKNGLMLIYLNQQRQYIKNKVDWHQRDIEVADIAKKLLNQYLGNTIMSRTELDRLLGSHGWLIKYKGKLPITMAVYEQYLKSH